LKETVVDLPKIASYDEWAAARKALLVKEKEATKQRDRLNAERRELPIPWYSSGDSDFNYDFGVTIDASRGFPDFAS
jgi:predicted dithiol-disulfide oxidoreductase (DUF899 family)